MSIQTLLRPALVAVLLVLTMAAPVEAQRGIGDPFGMANRADKPSISAHSGTILSVRTGPCESTTGRSYIGTHLIVRLDSGSTINLHLGPTSDISAMISALDRGTYIAFDAFRTDEMADDALVATTIRHGSDVIVLRDETLRPVWAGRVDRPRRYMRY